MKHHSLILRTPKSKLPKVVTFDFVTDLMSRGLLRIEYFGIEIDNQADYLDAHMKQQSDESTFINVNFDTEQVVIYSNLTIIELENYLKKITSNSNDMQISNDENDITINL